MREQQVQILHYDDQTGTEMVATSDLLTHVLGVPIERQGAAHTMRLGTIMKRYGLATEFERPGAHLRAESVGILPAASRCRTDEVLTVAWWIWWGLEVHLAGGPISTSRLSTSLRSLPRKRSPGSPSLDFPSRYEIRPGSPEAHQPEAATS